jgi:hypothetical protein
LVCEQYSCVVSQVSNIIFVDSPVGTGFSYAKSKEGLKTGDTKAVKQLLIFLTKVELSAQMKTQPSVCFSLKRIVVCSGSKTIPGSCRILFISLEIHTVVSSFLLLH